MAKVAPAARLAMAPALAMEMAALTTRFFGLDSSSCHDDGSFANMFGYGNITGYGDGNSLNTVGYGSSTRYGDGSSGSTFGYGNIMAKTLVRLGTTGSARTL